LSEIVFSKIICLFRFETSTLGGVEDGNNRRSVLQDGGCSWRCIHTLWISSQEHPSLLYSCRMDTAVDDLCLRYSLRTPFILKAMIDGANLPATDPKNTLINLIGESEMGLFIRLTNCASDGDTPSAIRLSLSTPGADHWKAHLLSLIETLGTDLRKERWRRQLLEKDAVTMKTQIAQMERNQGWQEKELEMLYAVVAQQAQASSSALPPYKQHLSARRAVVSLQKPNRTATFTQSSVAKSDVMMGDGRTEGLRNDNLLLGVVSRLLCSLCPDEVHLTDQECMRQHFVSRHLDREMGRCRACPEVRCRVDPVAHMKMHSSRVYACEFCGKKGRKHYLKAHIRTHTGEKPFTCQVCARSFADSSTFRRHQMVHTGEKKHSCPICGRCIARKDNVKTHIRSHARLILSSRKQFDDICSNSFALLLSWLGPSEEQAVMGESTANSWQNSTTLLLSELITIQESLLTRLEDASLKLSRQRIRTVYDHLSKSERYITLLHSLHDEILNLSQRSRQLALRAQSLSKALAQLQH
uniref:Zinc finger protein n=1 Tax=Toxocara canis TaxID=6265 RepID=A0A183UMU4_TOXCA